MHVFRGVEGLSYKYLMIFKLRFKMEGTCRVGPTRADKREMGDLRQRCNGENSPTGSWKRGKLRKEEE